MAKIKEQSVGAEIRYTDSEGQKKSVRLTLGKMYRHGGGVIVTRLDLPPVRFGWDGTLALFDDKNDNYL